MRADKSSSSPRDLVPQLQMLLLQFFPLYIKRLEILNRLFHFVGAVGNAALDQLPQPISRGFQVNAYAVKPRR